MTHVSASFKDVILCCIWIFMSSVGTSTGSIKNSSVNCIVENVINKITIDRNTRIIHQILGKQVRKTVNLTGVFCYGRVFRIGLRVDCRLSMSRWMSVGRRRCIFMSPTAALWVCCHSEHCSCLGHRSGQRQRIVSNDIHFLKHLPIGWNHQGSLSPVTEPDPYLLLWRSIFFGSPRWISFFPLQQVLYGSDKWQMFQNSLEVCYIYMYVWESGHAVKQILLTQFHELLTLIFRSLIKPGACFAYCQVLLQNFFCKSNLLWDISHQQGPDLWQAFYLHKVLSRLGQVNVILSFNKVKLIFTKNCPYCSALLTVLYSPNSV